MPKLSDYTKRAETNTVTIGEGDSALHVTYRPAVITPKFQKMMVAALSEKDVDAGVLWPLSELVASWDLTQDDGTPIPTTPDGFSEVPTAGLLKIMTAIFEYQAPNPPTAGSSSNGSSPTGDLEPALNGSSS